MDIRLEKRLSPRRNTVIEATIVFDGGRSRMRCIIRNLSESGAKLEVASVTKIPRTFDLVVDKVRPQPCLVVWRSVKELGVQFQDTSLR
ncbi:PilZ domain-containing protein [Devosia sp. ZB163]|uniref:PilZ domain-containing protein n=1 Tax=Devosia sp. ZB163 TaxID=3025938 RepID=UPI00235E0314|nr:PilZ domain-containing protein [Devosia sp. ZB163]MDC9824539.1 PilZ domain-containing protein [Devosia sp. ZB163]